MISTQSLGIKISFMKIIIKKHFIILLTLFSFTANAKMEMGYSLIDLESGKEILSKNNDIPYTLASVSKLFTIYYALNQLDVNDRFETKIYQKGRIQKGVLKGDLYFVGDGDPYLTAPHLISLIYQIKKLGIKSITGHFYVNDSKISLFKEISSIGLEDQADNPSLGALNVEFNRFKMIRNDSNPHPPLKYFEIKDLNIKKDGLKFKHTSSKMNLESWNRHIKERHAFIEEIPVKNATAYTAHFFHYLASLHGLSLPLPKRNEAFQGRVIANHYGIKVSELASLCFEYSNNLIAEQLLLRASKKKTIQEATKTMFNWYKKSFKDINWKKITLKNGSGLNLENTAAPSELTKFLAKIYNDTLHSRPLISYLSINGHSGGLSKRLRSSQFAYKIYGKTGSLFFVNNLAGYLISNTGKRFAYSIFTSDPEKRDLLSQKPPGKKLEPLRQKSKNWYQKSVIKIDAMLMKWLNKY
jgi:D-alanyl-D-alanine carboxypeptidase/D-alanyl-D-alanine-endopeptidase (penicillin-binding protein 4)